MKSDSLEPTTESTWASWRTNLPRLAAAPSYRAPDWHGRGHAHKEEARDVRVHGGGDDVRALLGH
eukprot:15455002-Alexandrium_andersonii.AAC.1